jgi:hypothetical protein
MTSVEPTKRGLSTCWLLQLAGHRNANELFAKGWQSMPSRPQPLFCDLLLELAQHERRPTGKSYQKEAPHPTRNGEP